MGRGRGGKEKAKSESASPTFHQVLPLLRTSGGNVELKLVDGHPVGDGQVVDALVRGLPGQQFPQHDPVAPDVAGLGEGGGLDDLRGHPSVGTGGGHAGGAAGFASQAEVRDLERLEQQVVVAVNVLADQDCREQENRA